MTDRGWCPFARQHRGYYAEGPFGYPAGTKDQNIPVMFVDHTMGGYKRTLDDDAWRHENHVGVHFGIGVDGSVDQYTSIFDASWGNGVSGSVQKYDRKNRNLGLLETQGQWIAVNYAGTRAYALIRNGVNLPNTRSISTEHEDKTVADPVWSDAMLATDIKVKNWCLEEMGKYGMTMVVDADCLVGHYQIDAVNRAHCPGDNYPRAAILAGITEEDMAAIELVWVPMPGGGGRLYSVGGGTAIWITDQIAAKDLVASYGEPKRALSYAAIKGLGG